MPLTQSEPAAQLLTREVYGPTELAALLGIHPDVVRHAALTDALPALILGHDVVAISRADALAWLNERALIGTHIA